MKKYKVKVKKTNFGHFSISANNEKEAKRKALDLTEKKYPAWYQEEIRVSIDRNKLINYLERKT